jgi:hypothetical protein
MGLRVRLRVSFAYTFAKCGEKWQKPARKNLFRNVKKQSETYCCKCAVSHIWQLTQIAWSIGYKQDKTHFLSWFVSLAFLYVIFNQHSQFFIQSYKIALIGILLQIP